MKTALLFAGQATQYVGMGKFLYDGYPEARDIFNRANAALGEPLSRIVFEGPEDELNRTVNTQPAVLTVACAALAVLKQRKFVPTVVAGHSLGEFGALVATGALGFEDAVRLCRRRGTYMQSAVPEGVGAMAAVLGVDSDMVLAACHNTEGVCVPAAFNAPGNTVISGEKDAVERVSVALRAQGAMLTPLAVSAPFHCPLLAPAADQLADYLATVPFRTLQIPYVCNVDAEWIDHSSAEALRDRLTRQMVGVVRWQETIALMLAQGVERFWHIGPGRVNLGHVKKQNRQVVMATLDDPKVFEPLIDYMARTSGTQD